MKIFFWGLVIIFFILNFQILAVFKVVYSSPIVNSNPGKIVGGDYITIDRVPYIVSLQYFEDHECGGTIITDWFILTAAHCIDE